jgi:hypothetical protein
MRIYSAGIMPSNLIEFPVRYLQTASFHFILEWSKYR